MKQTVNGIWLARVLCLLVLAPAPLIVKAQTVFAYSSAPGDVLGAGKTRSFTTANATFELGSDPSAKNLISITVDGGGEQWGINLKVPVGQVLAPGRYADAEIFSVTRGRSPGIAIGSNLGGCNDAWGSFGIRQVTWDTKGQLVTFEADFIHRCDLADAPPLAGVIRWKAPQLSLTLDGPLLFQGAKQSFYGDTSTFRVDGDTEQFFYTASGQRTEWLLLAQAPIGKQLKVGHYVTNNLPTATRAGLSIIHGQTRCQTYTGTLDIRRITLEAGGFIKAIYADFEQHCAGVAGSVKGTIHYGL